MSLEKIMLPKYKSRYANMGVDFTKYSNWDDLEFALWVTDRESVFMEDAYQARVEYADSNILAVRAFIFNILDCLLNNVT